MLLMWASMSVVLSQLSVGEACRLRRADIMLPGDANWHVQVGMVVIRAPKAARSAGRIQHVVVTGPFVLMMAQWAWSGWAPMRPLTSFQLKDFSRWFQQVLTAIGLPPLRYTPAGLRAGGCTHAYLSGSSVEQHLWRGRWAAAASLRHFVQKSASVLALGRSPLASTQKLEALAAALAGVFHALTLAWAD